MVSDGRKKLSNSGEMQSEKSLSSKILDDITINLLFALSYSFFIWLLDLKIFLFSHASFTILSLFK